MKHTAAFTAARDALAYTDRTLPAPWAECDVCGGPVAALPDPDGSPRCPACAAHNRMTEAALEHLGQLIAPVLSAWAHHYAAQGMTIKTLRGTLEQYSGGDLNHVAQAEHLHHLITSAMTVHPRPSFTPAPPDRVQLDARTLPQLTGFTLDQTAPSAEGAGGIDRRVSFEYLNSDGRASTMRNLTPGRDVLLILNVNPEHDALLYYTGLQGHTQTRPSYSGDAPAYRVPAHLLPQVRAALGYWGQA